MLATVFWLSLALGLYPYVIYPLLAALFAGLKRRHVARSPLTPTVSVVISAYNEAKCIEATIRNKLARACAYGGRYHVRERRRR